MGVRKEEYAMLRRGAKQSGRVGFMLHPPDKPLHRFYMKGDDMWVKIHGPGEPVIMKVIDVDNLTEEQARPRREMLAAVEKMSPNLSAVEKEAHADIYLEAINTVKRLCERGVPWEAAKKMVDHTLKNDVGLTAEEARSILMSPMVTEAAAAPSGE
jgi:hypothetical protein